MAFGFKDKWFQSILSGFDWSSGMAEGFRDR